MRIWLPPLSVTFPPPSMTVLTTLFMTFAVCVSVIVTGASPQANVTTPPFAIAATVASLVPLGGVPEPTVVVGAEMSSSGGADSSHFPFGLPGGLLGGLGVVVVGGAGVPGGSAVPAPGGPPLLLLLVGVPPSGFVVLAGFASSDELQPTNATTRGPPV